MTTEEMVNELDKIGYELSLDDLTKEDLRAIYMSVAEVSDEEEEKVKKYSKKILVSKCLDLGDFIDLDTLPESVLKKLLADAGVDKKTNTDAGAKMEEVKRKRQNHKTPDKVVNKKPQKDSNGVVAQTTGVSKLKSIQVAPDEARELSISGKIVGYDPVKQVAYIRED